MENLAAKKVLEHKSACSDKFMQYLRLGTGRCFGNQLVYGRSTFLLMMSGRFVLVLQTVAHTPDLDRHFVFKFALALGNGGLA